MTQVLREEDVRTIMQAAIDCTEGHLVPTHEEELHIGYILQALPEEFAHILIKMYGSTDAALEKLQLLMELIRVGEPSSTAKQ